MGAFNPGHVLSNTSSIRLHITPHDNRGIQGHLAHFLSLPFPALSKLDIDNFLPGSSSSIFTTSNLTSLKLRIPYYDESHYTLSQLSQIL